MWIPIVLSVAFLSLLAFGLWWWRRDDEPPKAPNTPTIQHMAWKYTQIEDGAGGRTEEDNITEAITKLKVVCRVMNKYPEDVQLEMIRKWGSE